MRYVLKDIDEITDSREVLESTPHPFTRIFIYILMAILLSAFVWSYFSEKEILVKARGIIEPNKSIIKVSNEVSGKITSINFKDGDIVKKGQTLYTIDHSSLDIQKAALEDDRTLQTNEVSNLNRLKQSIIDGKNYFYINSNDEKEYYYKYQRYTEGINDINNSTNSIQVQIQNLKDQVIKYNLLEKSINDNKNYFNDNSSYNNQFNDYQDKIAVDSSNQDLTKYKNQFMQNINSTIEQYEMKIKELQSTPSLSQENGSNYTSTEEYKNDNLAQIENTIKTDKSKIDQDNSNIKGNEINIDLCTIKVPTDGVINALSQITRGDILQAGTQIASILPSVNSKYKLELYITNKDVGNIKKGQNVRCNFDALPYSQYGSINTQIKTLSADAKVSQNNSASYYTAEATIPNKPLYNKNGEKAQIKPGMSCEVEIITRREKMLYYLLEQINLKD